MPVYTWTDLLFTPHAALVQCNGPMDCGYTSPLGNVWQVCSTCGDVGPGCPYAVHSPADCISGATDYYFFEVCLYQFCGLYTLCIMYVCTVLCVCM